MKRDETDPQNWWNYSTGRFVNSTDKTMSHRIHVGRDHKVRVSILIVTALLVPLTLAQRSWADEPSWNLQIDLVDGSRIIGVPTKKSLKVDVKFGELEIPLERLRRADWKGDGKTIRIELNNDDVFTGTLKPVPVEIETIFGKVTLQMKHFKTLEVRPTNLLGWLPTTRGLVLYYPFDRVGDGVVTNLASDKHVGKLNESKWTKDGQRGGAIEFSGSTRIDVPHDAALCPATMTLAAWLKPHGDQSSYHVIVGKTQASSWNGGYGFVRIPGNEKMIHFFVNGYTDIVARTEIPPNAWSHVAGVCDGKSVTIYLNGKAMDTVPMRATSEPRPEGTPFESGEIAEPMAQPIRHTDVPLYIGSDARGYAWNGAIDELVIYGRALSANEVLRLCEASSNSK
jgi:hypothetical protein